jgi:stringent starvation protein B
MSVTLSTKPYLMRAIYEWCADNGFTPYIAVKVQGLVHVPMEFVRDGNIVLNISMSATNSLKMDNEAITFKARFGGVPRDIYVPVSAVAAIYASENNQGMAFEVLPEPVAEPATKKTESAPVNEKPAVSLAVTNKENSPAPDEKKPKAGRKKPSFTVIK